jgi:hypothetical protein
MINLFISIFNFYFRGNYLFKNFKLFYIKNRIKYKKKKIKNLKYLMQNFKIREIKKDDNELIKKLFRENIFNKMSYSAHSKAFKIINGFDKHFLIPLPYPIF